MRSIIVIIVSCMISVSATASDWIEIEDDKEATISVNVVDLRSQRIKNINSIGAWVKNVYKSPQINRDIGNGKPIAKFLSMQWYQCQNRSVSDPVEVAFYGVNGALIDSFSEEVSSVNFRHVVPDTIESDIQTVVCVVDLSEKMDKVSKGSYEYRKLESEYPYEFKLLKNHNSPD